MNKFEKKVALVTGGSRGIGQAISYEFAKEGAHVVVNYVKNKLAAKRCLDQLPGSSHLAIQADIGSPSGCQRLVDKTIDHFGTIDILINNAGIHEYHPVDEISFEKWRSEWRKILDINLFGAANLMYLCSQHMIKNGGGRIVNVSSRGAFRGEPDQPAYGASKAGLNALGQSMAVKLAPYNIYVGTVAPCFTETEMVADLLRSAKGEKIRAQSPLNKVAAPLDVAKGVLFLAEEGTEFMTGAILDINGASYLRS